MNNQLARGTVGVAKGPQEGMQKNLLVAIKTRTPPKIPKYYDPYCGLPKKRTHDFERPL